MRLYIVRHGETDFNRNRMMQGYHEIPLNGRGIRQATLLAHRLKEERLDRIICSDLRRAVMTGCIVASHTGAPMDYDPALRERNPGLLTGKSYDDEPRFFTDIDFIPPEGEGVRDFRLRVRKAFEHFASQAHLATERVAVITHGLVCHAFVSEFFGDDAAEGIGSRNAALTLAEYDGGRWTLVARDCATHLSGEEPPRIVVAGA
ncbi:MAG: histidine phosphatase family protein [Candidatus Hydrogenedentes bacterium]|nr:histidine phosphatase family protein [Candidatus Hydrogenedentota bacterium]